MNLNQKIQSFLKKHKNTKKRLSATALLSMLITLSVVSSLIMPAISMTMSEFISSTDAGSIAVYGATPGSYTNVANSQMLDILSADKYEMNISSNDNYFYNATQDGVKTNNKFEANSSPIDLSFYITYSFINSVKDKIPGNGPHLGLDLGNPNLTAVFPNNMDHGEIDDPNYDGGKAGDYVINNGRIEITLTPEYIAHLNSGNGTIQGTLDFSGSLGRSDTADGDQTLKVNGDTITIDFPVQHPTINKQYSIDNTNGTVNWTLTVYNTANIDLGGYTITDSMFTTYNDAVTKSLSWNPSEAGSYNNGVFTFKQGFNRTPITITYKTPITEEMLKDSSKRTNSATINKGTEYTSEKVERTVDLNNPFNVRKKGQTDYSQGKGYGNKIDWKITIDNNYGVSLDNYIIEDTQIPESDVTVSPSGSLEKDSNGKWKLSGVGNAKQVVITYQTNATVGDNSNTAKLKYPDGTPTDKEGTDTVNYPEKNTLVDITKIGSYSNGLAYWTINVSNQSNIDLNGYKVTDQMLANAISKPVIDPADAAKFDDDSNEVTLKSESKNTRLITITYQTKITAADLKNGNVSNEAMLDDPNSDNDKTAEKDIWLNKDNFNLTKTGTPDYNISGVYPTKGNEKIKWTITITNNDHFYLDGYIIEDGQIPESGGTVSPSGSLEKQGDKWVLKNVGNAQTITIEYEALVPQNQIGKSIPNTVKFKNPENSDKPIKEVTVSVEYKNESDLVTLGKNGSYDQNAHKINWTIHVQVEGGYNLATGYTIYDEMFKNIPIENIRINNQSAATYATIDSETGILTFTSHPGNAFDITYSQDVDIPEVTSPTTTVVANGYGPGPGTTSTATVNVNVREELTKTVSGDNSTPETAAKITREINWVAKITHDGKFDGKEFTDTLQQPTPSNSGTHKITYSQFNSIAVYGSAYSADNTWNMTLLTKDTDYEIVKNGDSGFTIKFKGTLDDKGYNFVRIEYKTTATANQLSMDPKPDFSYSVIFKNKAEFNSLNAEQSYTITREDPTKNEKMSLNIKKKWESDAETTRPKKAYFKVFYKKTGSNDWTQLKFAGDSYLFSGDSGYSSGTEILEIANNNSNEWNKTLSDLPSLIRGVKEEDGTPDTEIYYTYKIEEVDSGGNSLENNRLDSGNGFYNVSYENNKGVGYNGAVITATNTYYGNSDLTPKKTWSGGQNGIQSVTVRLEFEVDSQWYPVRTDENGYLFVKDRKDDSSPIATQVLTGENWTGASWENLPGAILIDGEYKSCRYRIVEIGYTKDDEYKEISDNKFIIDNGYYVISYPDNSTVHNAFNQTKSLGYSAHKEWTGDDSGGINHRPSKLIVQLEYSTNNWEYFPVRVDADGKFILDNASEAKIAKQEIDTNSSCSCRWTGLPNQSFTESGDVITYSYRAREVGYVYGDKTVTLKGNEGEEFAVDSAGWFTIGQYSDDENNNITTITNYYHLVGTIAITPQKKWEGDSGLDKDGNTLSSKNRPQDVTLKLQRQIDNTGDWEDVPISDSDSTPVTVKLSSANLLENQYSTDVIWQGDVIGNLPSTIITFNADGKSSKHTCTYRLVEWKYTPNDNAKDKNEKVIGANETSFKTDNGSYTVTFGSIGNNGELVVTNTFEENIGITKYVLDTADKEQRKISIDNVDFTADNSHFKKSFTVKDENGNDKTEDYYVFNWTVEYDSTDKSLCTPIVDTLPDGFELCYASGYGDKNGIWGAPRDFSIADLFDKTFCGDNAYDGYFPVPTFVWPKSGWGTCYCVPVEDNITGTKDQYIQYVWDNSNPDGHGLPNVFYYDKTDNKVYFNVPFLSDTFIICYSTRIKCSELDRQLEEGTCTIRNYALKHTLKGEPTDKDSKAEIKIINKVDQKLITKTYAGATRIPGYFKYSIDVNPQGKNLSNGDTIDIQDLLETVSYFDHDIGSSGETTTGKKLVDILMDSIKIYEVDANGNKIELPKNAYTLMFENGDKVTNGAALMKLTVPDETHIVVDYTYKMIANANTPSVIHGCKSSTRVNGRYAIMKPGFVPPADDIIKFKNTAKLIADSASDESALDNTEYKVFKSSGMITTTLLPKIVKVDTGDYSINELQAKFLIAKYENGKWYYAVEINDGGPDGTGSNDRVITWDVNGVEGTKVPEDTDLKLIEVRKSYEVALDEAVLYKLIEVQVPENYEGSNLGLGTNKEEENENFKKLLARYLNSGVTYFNGKDYSNFLNKYVSTHYFAYNSVITDYPDGITQNDVMQIKSGDNVEIPNNQLIDIGIKKEWINPRGSIADTSVNVELYWSAAKDSSKIPDDAKLADAVDLGIMDSGFTAQKTVDVTDEQGNALDTSQIWTDLPNGKDDKPIYYYVKETGYTIGGVTYTLNEDGNFTSESGAYKPTYIGNAANTDADINIRNSHQLMIKKQWKNSANVIMANPPVDEVKVSIFGIDADGSKTKEPLFKDIVLSSENNWTVDLTSLSQEIDLSQYKSFVAEEVDDPLLESYVVSCVFNLNGSIGEITVTNKNTEASDASVTVNKVWSDGEAVHAKDSIKATLYQSKTKLSADELKSIENRISANTNLYWVMQQIDENDKQTYKNAILNAESNWSYTWTGLPLEDENQNPYYYYVVEDKSGIANANSYTASYEYLSQTSTNTKYKITNTRQAIVVQKKWLEEDGVTIIPDNKLAQDSITLDVLKKVPSVPEDGIKISTIGDSITEGYATGYHGGYAPHLQTMLEESGYTVSYMGKHGHSQYAIKNMPDGTDYSSGENRSGILGQIDNDMSNESDVDIVLLMAGTNDIISNYPNNIDGRLQELIEKIHSKAPNAAIFVSSIPKFRFVNSNNSTTDSYIWFGYYSEKNTMTASAFEDYINNTAIKNYNTKIKNLVNTLSSDLDIHYVDVYSVLNKDTEIVADGCHPNDNGDKTIAGVWKEAINSYYTQTAKVGSITLTKANGWIGAYDIVDTDPNAEYYIKESSVPLNWTVSYENQYQKIGSSTPITAKNTRNIPKTSLSVEKTWKKDAGSTTRDKISLALLRSTDRINWEECDVAMPTPDKGDTVWTYNYTNLPAVDNSGNPYHYKVEEAPMTGYITSYGNPNGVLSEANGNAGTLTVTNTAAVSLKLRKVWSDIETNDHQTGSVTFHIYRAIKDNGSDNTDVDLILELDKTDVGVTVGSDVTVTANKGVTFTQSEGSENFFTATLGDDGKTINIRGVAEGEGTITVTDGIDTYTINVKVSAYKLWIDDPDAEQSFEITAGEQTHKLSVTKGGAEFTDVTYSSSDTGVLAVDANGGNITTVNAGTATVTVSTTDGTWSCDQDITVNLPETFGINGEDRVTSGSEIQLSVSPSYGTFTWSSDKPSIATVDANGKVTAIEPGTVTITATRNDSTEENPKVATKTITVENGDIYDNPNIVIKVRVGETIDVKTKATHGNSIWNYSGSIIGVTYPDSNTIRIEGKQEGTTTMEMHLTYDNNTKYNVKISVEVIGAFKVTPTSKTLVYGESVTLVPNMSGNITYSVISGSEYVSLNSSTVTAKSGNDGTAVIRVTNNDTNETVDVTINVSSVRRKVFTSGENFEYQLPSNCNNNIESISLTISDIDVETSGEIGFDLYLNSTGGEHLWIPFNRNPNSIGSPNKWGDDNHSVSVNGNTITLAHKGDSYPTISKLIFQIKSAVKEFAFEQMVITDKDGNVTTITDLEPAAKVRSANSISPQMPMLLGAGTNDSDTPTPASYDAAGESFPMEVKISGGSAGGSAGGWETVVENLDVYAPNGQEYIYWVEEDTVNGYKASYQFSDGDPESSYWINASKPNSDGELVVTVRNNKTDTPGYELPSTGGRGVKVYYYTGAAMILLSAIAGSNRIRRRLKERRTK